MPLSNLLIQLDLGPSMDCLMALTGVGQFGARTYTRPLGAILTLLISTTYKPSRLKIIILWVNEKKLEKN